MFPVLLAAVTTAATAAASVTHHVAPHATATLSPAQMNQLLQSAQFAGARPQSPLAQHVPWLTHIFAVVFVIAALLMIFLLAIQTTKQEGLSGTIGGRVESAYRGRVGADKQIARFTQYAAITFVIFATILSLSGIAYKQ